MKTHIRLSLFSILTIGVTAISTGLSCDPKHVATAVEITASADVILLVKVPEVSLAKLSRIEMSVIEVIKGNFESKTVTVLGQTVHYEGANDQPVPYDFVRSGGRHGDCFARDYKSGGHFLLFLKHGGVHWSPLAATNEEVSGSKDPWVLWVKDRLKKN